MWKSESWKLRYNSSSMGYAEGYPHTWKHSCTCKIFPANTLIVGGSWKIDQAITFLAHGSKLHQNILWNQQIPKWLKLAWRIDYNMNYLWGGSIKKKFSRPLRGVQFLNYILLLTLLSSNYLLTPFVLQHL